MRDSIIEFIQNKLDHFIAFVGGDVLATTVSAYFIQDLDWIHPLVRIIVSLTIGIFGGIGGLIGKDLYTWFKKKK